MRGRGQRSGEGKGREEAAANLRAAAAEAQCGAQQRGSEVGFAVTSFEWECTRDERRSSGGARDTDGAKRRGLKARRNCERKKSQRFLCSKFGSSHSDSKCK